MSLARSALLLLLAVLPASLARAQTPPQPATQAAPPPAAPPPAAPPPAAPPPAAPPPAAPPPAAPPPAAPPPAVAWLAQPVAELQGLDKITARLTPLTIPVGRQASFGSLTVFVRACMVRPPDQAGDAAIYVDITDQHAGVPAFHGWLIASMPGASILQHPVYDIRPTGCHA